VTDDRSPQEQLLDLCLYAPLGLLSEIGRIGPELAKVGRDRFETRVNVARMIGQFAVAKGKMELAKRTATAPATTPASPPIKVERVDPVVAADAPSVESLALHDYDTLAAAQIVTRLASLMPSELDAIEAYERGHRGRRTILSKIAQLRQR
jgi:hypothetical protein